MTGRRFQAVAPDNHLVDVYLSILRQLSSRHTLAVPVRRLAKGRHRLSINVPLHGAQTVGVDFELAHGPGTYWAWIVIGLAAVIAAVAVLLWRARRVDFGWQRVESHCSCCQQPLAPDETGQSAACSAKMWLDVVGGAEPPRVVLNKDLTTLGRGRHRFRGQVGLSRPHRNQAQARGRYFLKATRRSDAQTHMYVTDKQIEIDEPLATTTKSAWATPPEKVIFVISVREVQQEQRGGRIEVEHRLFDRARPPRSAPTR
jgi:hypothetical protein